MKFGLLLCTAIVLFTPVTSSAAGVDCNDLTTSEGLVAATAGSACPNITLRAGISMNEPWTATMPGENMRQISTMESGVTLFINSKVSLKNVIFTNIILVVGSDGDFSCLNCDLVNATLHIGGKATVLNGRVGYVIIDSAIAKALFSSVTFENAVNYSSNFVIKSAADVDISNSNFLIKQQSALNLVEANKQVVMIANNSYNFVGANQDLASNLEKIFVVGSSGTNMGRLGSPAMRLVAVDDNFFTLEITQPQFTTDKWNGITCPGSAHGRNINFEPYLLYKEAGLNGAIYPMGIFGAEDVDGRKYLKIPKGKIRFGSNEFNVIGERIAVLAHCEGYSTSMFSQILRLTECPANEVMTEGICDCAVGYLRSGNDNTCSRCDSANNYYKDATTGACLLCSGEHRIIKNNACICETPFTLGSSGECVAECLENEEKSPDNVCICIDDYGRRSDITGANGEKQACVKCTDGFSQVVAGGERTCRCRGSFVVDLSGKCAAECTVENSTADSSNICKCKASFAPKFNVAEGLVTCEPTGEPPPGLNCPEGQQANADGTACVASEPLNAKGDCGCNFGAVNPNGLQMSLPYLLVALSGIGFAALARAKRGKK